MVKGFNDINDFVEKIKKMEEEDIEKAFKLESSEDFFIVEKIYDNFVGYVYKLAESDPLVRSHIPLVSRFAMECIKNSGISSLREFNEKFSAPIERMKEIQFSNSKIGDIFNIPTGDVEEDIKILMDAYCTLYERIIGDKIRPYISLVTQEKHTNTKGKIVNQMKTIFGGKYKQIVDCLIPLIRNAPSHDGVRYSSKRDIIIFEDREKKIKKELSPLELQNYVMQLFTLDFAFIYVNWKRSEYIDRQLIAGAHKVKEIAPDWKLVPDNKITAGKESMGDLLLKLARKKGKKEK